MKETFLPTAVRIAAKRIPLGLGCALALTFPHLNATAQDDVNLGTANNFAVLAGSAITVTTAANALPSTVNADIGSYPTPTVTGTSLVFLNGGVNETGDSGLMQTAKNDLATAYGHAAGLTPTATIGSLTGELGGLTLTPGVYNFTSSSADLTGTLTLNDEGNPDAVFVFQIGSTLTTASDSSVVEEDISSTGAITPDANPGMSVFWQVGSSAVLGTGTQFAGNILAYASITDDSGSTVQGRLLAENAAVTLENTTINVPPAETAEEVGAPDTGSTLLLLGAGLSALCAFGRRLSVLLR